MYTTEYTGDEVVEMLERARLSYVKPVEGIPEGDMTPEVQAKLGAISSLGYSLQGISPYQQPEVRRARRNAKL